MNSVEKQLIRDPLVANIIYRAKIQDSGITFNLKKSSKLLSFIGFFAKYLNPNWKDSLITLNKSIYLPDWYVEYTQFSVHKASGIAHEVVHVLDKKKIGYFRFILGYAYPQILALGVLLCLGCLWSWWFLASVGFLVALWKWKAPWRAEWELRGYTATLAVQYWATGVYNEQRAEEAANSLSGSPYWYCCPDAKEKLAKVKQELLQKNYGAGSVLDTEFLQSIRQLFVLPK